MRFLSVSLSFVLFISALRFLPFFFHSLPARNVFSYHFCARETLSIVTLNYWSMGRYKTTTQERKRKKIMIRKEFWNVVAAFTLFIFGKSLVPVISIVYLLHSQSLEKFVESICRNSGRKNLIEVDVYGARACWLGNFEVTSWKRFFSSVSEKLESMKEFW